MIIEVEDLWYTYPGSSEPALRGVDLEVDEGELVAIVGENGAGKTTLAKHFIGLLRPQRGRVLVAGLDASRCRVSQLARVVGFVFQNPDHQLFSETVIDEVSFAPRNLGVEGVEERAWEAIRSMGLERYATRSPLTLSSGERRRVALASVLSYRPKVLVLDEPTVGQDARQKLELASTMRRLVEEGRSVIVITHDLEFVAEHVPRTVVLSRGRVVADGRTEDVLSREEVLRGARLVPPPIARICSLLAMHGLLDRAVYDVDSLAMEVARRVRGERPPGALVR